MEKTVSCLAQGGGEADFLLLQPLSHIIEKLHNFLKRPECWAVKCQGWITILSSTSGLFWDMNERKTSSPEYKVNINKKIFYFFRMMGPSKINPKVYN